MKMSQYVYFSLASEVVTAAEITAELGLNPDKTTTRGSRTLSTRVVPINHSWEIHSRDQTRQIDDQAAEVLDRLRPIDAKLRQIMAGANVAAHLVFVRYFNDDEGIDEVLDQHVASDGTLSGRFAGQHQMLGWYLSTEQLRYLASIPAAISADEYG